MMKRQFSVISFFLLLAALLGACASEEIRPLGEMPEIPKYSNVPHPQGFDLTDIDLIFVSDKAPGNSELENCDSVYLKLQERTQSEYERRRGARELVIADPARHHWCFYFRLAQLEAKISDFSTILKRQKQLIETFEYLTPIAEGFKDEYSDPRYLRFALRYYRQMSEWVFYRKLEITPEANRELLDPNLKPKPLLARSNKNRASILKKYGLLEEAEPQKPTEADRTAKIRDVEEAFAKEPDILSDFSEDQFYDENLDTEDKKAERKPADFVGDESGVLDDDVLDEIQSELEAEPKKKKKKKKKKKRKKRKKSSN